MKRIIAATAIVLAVIGSTFAQEPITNETPTVQGALQDLWEAVTSGNTNWYFEAHALYAPKLASKYGGGIGAYYPLSPYVVAGLRCDWVNGGFWMPSGNATLQVPIKPFKFWPKFSITPFGYAGVGIPLSGATFGDFSVPGASTDNNGEPTAILGYGAAIGLWKNKADNMGLALVADVEKWSGFEGRQYRGGLILRWRF